MTDRRRINAPVGGTLPATFSSELAGTTVQPSSALQQRKPHEIRKIFLKTQLTPSASGSAYLEFEQATATNNLVLHSASSSLKLTCSVHGPRPLPRSASFSPHMLLSTHVKFAPFATKHRRGYLRDATERDLAAHLETALRGVIISDRWPKSSIEVIVTILEGEEDFDSQGHVGGSLQHASGVGNLPGIMSILSGCITVASAAIIAAGIDCIDIASGGVAALIKKEEAGQEESRTIKRSLSQYEVFLDPVSQQQKDIVAVCSVGYLKSLDEITEMWMSAGIGPEAFDQATIDGLIEGAMRAASASSLAIREAVKGC